SPEQLFPTINTHRVTASATYNRTWSSGWSQTTAAWGRNYQLNIDTLDAWLLESAVNVCNDHTFFARYENIQKDDLLTLSQVQSLASSFPNGQPVLHIFTVNRVTLGYIYDF